MNQNELVLTQSDLVPTDEKHELDQLINQTVEKYKGNSAQIARFTVDSVTSLAIVESRTNELESQNFLKRTYRNLTGKNNKLKDNISYNQRNAQYAAQQTLSKLAEQNLLTFDVLTAVNSKLNAYMISNSLEINEMYFLLLQFISQTKGNVLKAEDQLSHLNQRVELLFWSQTAEHLIFNDTPYTGLDIASKVARLTSDFYTISKGVWDTKDLILLKSVLKALGEDSNRNIGFDLILERFINDAPFRDSLQKVIRFDYVQEFSEIEIPMIYSLFKACSLVVNEKYVVRTILDNLASSGIEKSESKLTKELTLNYIVENGQRNLTIEQPVFELINELLIELKIVNNFIPSEVELLSAPIDSEAQLPELKEDELYEVVILDYEMDKFELTMLLTEILNLDVREVNSMLDEKRLLYRILSGITEKKATEISEILNEHQVESIIVSKSNPVQIVYLDVCKFRKDHLRGKKYRFDFSKHLNRDFKISDLKDKMFLNPYSVIGAFSMTTDLGTFRSFEIYVANIQGEIVKVFRDLKTFTLSEDVGNEERIALFAVRNIGCTFSFNERHCFYTNYPVENHRGKIYMNILDNYDF